MIELQAELATPTSRTIRGAENEIRDALTNLIFNAVDALPQGGRIDDPHAHANVRGTVATRTVRAARSQSTPAWAWTRTRAAAASNLSSPPRAIAAPASASPWSTAWRSATAPDSRSRARVGHGHHHPAHVPHRNHARPPRRGRHPAAAVRLAQPARAADRRRPGPARIAAQRARRTKATRCTPRMAARPASTRSANAQSAGKLFDIVITDLGMPYVDGTAGGRERPRHVARHAHHPAHGLGAARGQRPGPSAAGGPACWASRHASASCAPRSPNSRAAAPPTGSADRPQIRSSS